MNKTFLKSCRRELMLLVGLATFWGGFFLINGYVPATQLHYVAAVQEGFEIREIGPAFSRWLDIIILPMWLMALLWHRAAYPVPKPHDMVYCEASDSMMIKPRLRRKYKEGPLAFFLNALSVAASVGFLVGLAFGFPNGLGAMLTFCGALLIYWIIDLPIVVFAIGPKTFFGALTKRA